MPSWGWLSRKKGKQRGQHFRTVDENTTVADVVSSKPSKVEEDKKQPIGPEVRRLLRDARDIYFSKGRDEAYALIWDELTNAGWDQRRIQSLVTKSFEPMVIERNPVNPLGLTLEGVGALQLLSSSPYESIDLLPAMGELADKKLITQPDEQGYVRLSAKGIRALMSLQESGWLGK